MTVPLALIRNDDQSAHMSPGHPERPDRVVAILEGIAADDELAALPWLDANSIATTASAIRSDAWGPRM